MLRVEKQLSAVELDINNFKDKLNSSLIIDDVLIEEELLDSVFNKNNSMQYDINNNIIPLINKKI